MVSKLLTIDDITTPTAWPIVAHRPLPIGPSAPTPPGPVNPRPAVRNSHPRPGFPIREFGRGFEQGQQ